MKQAFKLANHEVVSVHPSSAGDDLIDWGLNDIGAPNVWPKSTGLDVRVAILDTGVDFHHPDLKENIKAVIDFTGSSYGGRDRQGHGSHCAGIIGAEDNGQGMIGVAPQTELYCAKVLSDNGSGGFDSIIKGIRWAIDKKVHLISMSLGCAMEPPQELHDAIKAAAAAGIIMVAATGNENHYVDWPAMYDEVIAVSAMGRNHERASFSNYGLKNEIMAPGVDILSCYKDGGYARLSGTSMATPLMAGSIALYLSYLLRRGEVIPATDALHTKLLASSIDLGAPGKDAYFGDGVINLEKLLA
ncbi:Subtilase family protein [Paenibacillus sp. UNC496MF]|uniref:S8 family peptidase n=1 Tax=Paenibacillus sp. UNC496MF TaxID=1502753 RepID=UPI0008E6B4BB|nr:S8 family peptidase [Paenibacillus sp. UNC496MF]SFJ65147.1 Subtilase family protein [Paenibacillus sp. UNC496MF]